MALGPCGCQRSHWRVTGFSPLYKQQSLSQLPVSWLSFVNHDHSWLIQLSSPLPYVAWAKQSNLVPPQGRVSAASTCLAMGIARKKYFCDSVIFFFFSFWFYTLLIFTLLCLIQLTCSHPFQLLLALLCILCSWCFWVSVMLSQSRCPWLVLLPASTALCSCCSSRQGEAPSLLLFDSDGLPLPSEPSQGRIRAPMCGVRGQPLFSFASLPRTGETLVWSSGHSWVTGLCRAFHVKSALESLW